MPRVTRRSGVRDDILDADSLDWILAAEAEHTHFPAGFEDAKRQQIMLDRLKPRHHSCHACGATTPGTDLTLETRSAYEAEQQDVNYLKRREKERETRAAVPKSLVAQDVSNRYSVNRILLDSDGNPTKLKTKGRKPREGPPLLLTWQDCITFFPKLPHTWQWVLCVNCKDKSHVLEGVRVARFVKIHVEYLHQHDVKYVLNQDYLYRFIQIPHSIEFETICSLFLIARTSVPSTLGHASIAGGSRNNA
ncbi:hypothetical protein LTR10_004277 [Elasticomyces elasticus]|nr:hypothetical protein LTR10_004277 [Elasticomyces elasticus]KAK4977544.1 hypothetical protein LTR42_001914 [Elasticomyces elasticus]